jgi:NDP-sugar pyrophosphorylase family protein
VTLALVPNPDPARYSPVVLDRRGLVRSIAGRPAPAVGRPWLFAGVHLVDPRLLERLPEGPSDSVRDLYIPLLGTDVKVCGVPVTGAWYDFGSPWRYLRSHMALLSTGFHAVRRARRLVHPGARIAASARVERSVVGDGCVIDEGARVIDSVLWERVRVGAGARVRGSILASGARVEAGGVRERAILVSRRAGPIEGRVE